MYFYFYQSYSSLLNTDGKVQFVLSKDPKFARELPVLADSFGSRQTAMCFSADRKIVWRAVGEII